MKLLIVATVPVVVFGGIITLFDKGVIKEQVLGVNFALGIGKVRI